LFIWRQVLFKQWHLIFPVHYLCHEPLPREGVNFLCKKMISALPFLWCKSTYL
jgi:hypothetical protein